MVTASSPGGHNVSPSDRQAKAEKLDGGIVFRPPADRLLWLRIDKPDNLSDQAGDNLQMVVESLGADLFQDI